MPALLAWLAGAYAAGAAYGYATRGLAASGYPSPDDAEAEMDALAAAHPGRCTAEVIGRSGEGRPLRAFRIAAAPRTGPVPRLLVTAHIHAVEYIGSFVARAVARHLVAGYGRVAHVTRLLDRAEVWLVPLLNPDGAARVWRRGGWSGLGRSRFTANGVDPNRNFPYVAVSGRRGWNTKRDRPGSAYYAGPHPLSEPECLALARLAARERFCAAVNFHSFGGVVFLPAVGGPDADKANRALAIFAGPFQSHQPRLPYRPVPERAAATVGQLDPFLLGAFGTPSATIEVSRPGPASWATTRHLLLPWNTFNIFWWANPRRPQEWVANDADAAIHALDGLLQRTGGTPCVPAHPELARLEV